jgi:hypothetical protein
MNRKAGAQRSMPISLDADLFASQLFERVNL